MAAFLKVKKLLNPLVFSLAFLIKINPVEAREYSFWDTRYGGVFDRPEDACEYMYTFWPYFIYKPENNFDSSNGNGQIAYTCGGNDTIHDIKFGITIF
ncbi:hypothetical protein [Pseudomonas sp. Irchel 3A5]|uniref:hypothetical protein n=1 Tax=Pseudomonas sp. Irchel 3A5 TaxID=2008911 RepID=UPI000BA4E1DB|nr:hypothetical protein [Pseudomonas sp. Irchel 3A5]